MILQPTVIWVVQANLRSTYEQNMKSNNAVSVYRCHKDAKCDKMKYIEQPVTTFDYCLHGQLSHSYSRPNL